MNKAIEDFADMFQGEIGCDECPMNDLCKSKHTAGMYCAEVVEMVIKCGIEAVEREDDLR